MQKTGVNKTAHHFEKIFAVSDVGIVVVDQSGTILRGNPAATKMLGYEEHELSGKSFHTLTFKTSMKMSQSTLKHHSQSSLQHFYVSEKSGIEMTLLHKQGYDVPVRFRAFLFNDNNNQLIEAVGMFEQLSELTRGDEAREPLAEKMWEAQQNFLNI